MPSIIPSRRAALAVSAVLALPATAALAHSTITPKTGGIYSSSKSHKSVSFTVVKKGKKLQVVYFSISCYVSGSKFGAIYASNVGTISSSGEFSYNGHAAQFMNGTIVGSATLEVSGKFVSSTKATGTASFSKAKLSGCPSKSFTATRSK
jgi:hypothetical protein